jgi:hypothetical protein
LLKFLFLLICLAVLPVLPLAFALHQPHNFKLCLPLNLIVGNLEGTPPPPLKAGPLQIGSLAIENKDRTDATLQKHNDFVKDAQKHLVETRVDRLDFYHPDAGVDG